MGALLEDANENGISTGEGAAYIFKRNTSGTWIEIQKIVKTDIVYFADQKNYPYGEKSQAQLNTIMKKTINLLEEKFMPDIIVVASNTPSLMLNLQTKNIVDVKPPLKLAQKKSKSKSIAYYALSRLSYTRRIVVEYQYQCAGIGIVLLVVKNLLYPIPNQYQYYTCKAAIRNK